MIKIHKDIILVLMLCGPIVTYAQLKYGPVMFRNAATIQTLTASNKAGVDSVSVQSSGASIVAKSATGNLEVITLPDLAVIDYRDGIKFSNIALSPDKNFIAFTVHGGARDLLGVVDMQAGSVRRLVELLGGGVGVINWSPDGRWVAIQLGFASGLEEVDVIDVRTGVRPIQQQILHEFHSKEVETRFLRWSLDSASLVFSAKSIESNVEKIWLIRPATGQLSQQ